MKLLKFGGTSVGSPENIKKVAKIVRNTEGPKIVVLSAMSQTTNVLHQISHLISTADFKTAKATLVQLLERYQNVVKDLYEGVQVQKKAAAFVEERFDFIGAYLHEGSLTRLAEIEKIIVAQGEILSTHLFQMYMEEISQKATLLSAFDFMRIDQAGEPDLDHMASSLKVLLEAETATDLFITQGYICLNPKGDIDNLKRGGSDYSASLIGAAVGAEEIQIWTDIDGMHNNDPRFVDKTFSLEEISFDEAAELAYFGAKILHPQSVIPAREKNIPVLLKNTFNPASPGTLIRNCEVPSRVRAIAAKDGITAIRIKSYRMLMAYGFLKKIFEVFEKYKTAIDTITTSEVAVSLTIDNTAFLDDIVRELDVFGNVVVDTDLSIICLAGNFADRENGGNAAIFKSLKDIPLRMISYGGSNYNVSLVVNTVDKVKSLQALNEGLFENETS